jgi:hypothetical protein
MAASRRGFLKLAGGVWLAPRRILAGDVGRVVFCRVSASSLAEAIDWLRLVFSGATPEGVSGSTLRYRDFVADYRPGSERELVICGSESTLVLNREGSRRFA